MGLIADIGSGGSQRPTYTARASVPKITPEPEKKRTGVLGFFQNAWDDVVEAGQGVGQLAGMVVSDLGQAGENFFETVGLNKETEADLAEKNSAAGEYFTDDIIKNAPSAIKADYTDRYGELFKGDLAGFGEEVYDSPLSFATDALTILTGGGALAAKAAGTGGKIAKTADTLADVGKIGDTAADVARIGDTAGDIGSVATKVADDVADVAKAAPTWQEKVLGQRKLAFDPVSKRFVDIGGYSKNPITRLKNQTVFEKAFTRKFDPSDLDSEFARFYAKQAEDAAKSGDTVLMDRVLTPNAALRAARKTGDRLFGSSRSAAYGERGEFAGRMHEALVPANIATGGDVDATFKAVTQPGAETSFDNTLDPEKLALLPDTGPPQVAPITRDVAKDVEPTFRNDLSSVFPGQIKTRIKDTKNIADGDLDVLGARIVDERAFIHPEQVLGEVERATGGKVIATKGVAGNEFGEMYQQATVQLPDGSVAEIQVVTPEGRTAMNSTSAVRKRVKEWDAEIQRQGAIADEVAEGADSQVLATQIDEMRAAKRVKAREAASAARRAIREPRVPGANAYREAFRNKDAAYDEAVDSIEGIDLSDPRLDELDVLSDQLDEARDALYDIKAEAKGAAKRNAVDSVNMPRNAGARKVDAVRAEREQIAKLTTDVDVDAAAAMQAKVDELEANIKTLQDEIDADITAAQRAAGVEARQGVPLPEQATRSVFRKFEKARTEAALAAREATKAEWDQRIAQMDKALAARTYQEKLLDDIDYAKSYARDKWTRHLDAMKEAQTGGEAVPSGIRRSINEMGDVQSSMYEDELIRDGKLSPADAWKDRFKVAQIRDLQERGLDIEWDADMELVGARPVRELDAERLARQESAPAYVPMIDATRLKKGHWMMGRANLKLESDKHLRHNTGKLIAEDAMVKDVEQATTLRAVRAISAKRNLELMENVIREGGRPIDMTNIRPGDDIPLFEGEVLVVPKLIFGQSRARTILEDRAIGAQLKSADEFTDEVRQSWEKIMDEDNALWETAQSEGIEAFAVPKVLADRLQDHASINLGPNVRTYYTAPMQMWKNMVLVGSPKWVMNNIIGSTIFAKMQGARLSDVVRQLSPKFRKRLQDALGETAEGKVAGGGFTGAQYDIKLGSAADEKLIARVAEKAAGSRAFKPVKKYSDWVRNIQAGTEDAFRRAGMVKALEREAVNNNIRGAAKRFWTSKATLEQIARAGADEKMVIRAAREMNEFANDYTALSPFESKIIKPYISPFYSFYKHSAKLLGTLPWKHPEVFTAMSAIASIEDQMIDDETLPGWMQGSVVPTGENSFMSVASMNPFGVLSNAPADNLNPLLKVAVEQSTGRSLFNSEPFTDPNVATTYGQTEGIRVDPVTGEVTQVEQTAPGLLEHLLQQVPQYNYAKQAIAGGRTYDTSTLIDALQGQALERDSEGEVAKPMTPGDVLGKYLFYPEFQTSPPDQQYQDQRIATLLEQLQQRQAGGR